jgi:quercetin dioxygenase-like cupin family protein
VQMEHGNAGDFWCILEDIRVPDMERRRGPPAEWGTTEGKARRILNLTDSSEKPLGQWNTMVIEAVGRSIKVWVNGDLVNEGSDATADHGQIALQSEGSEVEFRKLSLTPMSAQKLSTDSQAPQSTPFRLETVQWSEPYNGPLGYPKGAQRASVSTDPRSGGETYYARFPAGSRFALHWHAYAEYAVVLRGKVTHTLGKNSYALVPGDYVVIPPKVNHAWAADTSGDVILLIRRDGPSDFNFVTP